MNRRLSEQEIKLHKKNGSLPLMEIKDDSGKVIYSDRNLDEVSKWAVSAGLLLRDNAEKKIDPGLEFMETTECDNCQSKPSLFLTQIYKTGFRCAKCWKDTKAKEIPVRVERDLEELMKREVLYFYLRDGDKFIQNQKFQLELEKDGYTKEYIDWQVEIITNYLKEIINA